MHAGSRAWFRIVDWRNVQIVNPRPARPSATLNARVGLIRRSLPFVFGLATIVAAGVLLFRKPPRTTIRWDEEEHLAHVRYAGL